MRSFRLRLIVWTSVIAGAVMLAFGLVGIWSYEQFKFGKIDDTLIRNARRPVPPPFHRRHWDGNGDIMIRELERELGSEGFVIVYARGSEDWFDAESANVLEIDGYAAVAWGDWESVFSGESHLPVPKGELDLDGPMRPGFMNGGERRGQRGRDLMGGMANLDTQLQTVASASGDREWRICIVSMPGFNVIYGASLDSFVSERDQMRWGFGLSFPVALFVLAACIWIFVTRAIIPIKRLTTAVSSISAQNLSERIENEGTYEEFSGLIERFNDMLERLERSFDQATRFSADAAHELKTPLAILQGQLEAAFENASDGSEAQRQLASLLEETQRLKSITRKLLVLAKADAGSLAVNRESVDIVRLIDECIEAVTTAHDPEAEFERSCEKDDCLAKVDLSLTRQTLINLMGNAVTYRSPKASKVRVRVNSTTAGEVTIEITNECPPIPAEKRRLFFDRFTRGDLSRNRESEGTGLGLSLAYEFTRAQGGRLELLPFETEERIGFRLTL